MKTIPVYELKKSKSEFPKEKIQSSRAASEFIRKFYQDDMEIFESCFILLLNRANTTIGYAKISQGGISGTVVDVRIIAKYAIESLASSVILAHNHPSGNLNPSEQDDAITKKCKQTLAIMDVTLVDHLILTADGYRSYADEGAL